jgi:cyanophycinase
MKVQRGGARVEGSAICPSPHSSPGNMRRRLVLAFSLVLSACASSVVQSPASAAKVGPPRGTVIVVGGGVVGPEIVARFIQAAGGPDALIIDVPTAGGDTAYPPNWRGANFLKAGGAKNVVVLHTTNRKVADSDEFAAVLSKAGGVWFEGGRQWHLVDSYAGTKTERGFHDVLARGGVVGGSSAGASILGSYLLRGAREGNEIIMAPGYEVGFGFLRGVAIDQHVVARERLRDLADSLIPRHPELLGISEDEGTAWVVQGDVADIIGRNKAFVYGGRDATDPRKPFLTLYPGDRYDLAARRVIHRASEGSPVARAFVDSLVRGSGRVTVHVAQAGKVLIDQGFGIPDHPRYQPATTAPNFPLGGISAPLNALMEQLSAANDARRGVGAYAAAVNRRLFTPIGAHWTTVDSTGAFASNVDELYRLELVMESPRGFVSDTTARLPNVEKEWIADTFQGMRRLSAYGDANGRRNAFMRFPDQKLSIIVLSDRAELDAKAVAEAIAGRFASH